MNKKDKQKYLIEAASEAVVAKTELMERTTNDIIAMAAALARALKRGGTIYIAGNGGSSSDAMHFATELIVRLTGEFERRALPAVALTSNGSLLTAAGNDYGFSQIFARQVAALAGKKDILVVLSTSGNSENIILAAKQARKNGARVFALLGAGGGKMKKHADFTIVVPSKNVQRIQEEHIFIIHNIVQLIEWELFT